MKDNNSRIWQPSEDEPYFPDSANSTVMGQYLTVKEHEFIDIFLNKKFKNRLFLDIGGGSGRFAIPIFRKGANISVLDCDLKAISKLNNKNKNIPCIIGDGEKLPFKANTFDVVLIIEAIEYMQDKNLFIKECYRVLRKNNGLLIITILNKFSYKMFHPNRKKRPDFYFTSYVKFKNWLKKHQFDVESAYGFNWIPMNRTSDNFLIPFFAKLESILKLKYFPSISPWVIIFAKKS